MSDIESWKHLLGTLVLAVPALLVAAYGTFAILDIRVGEALISRLMRWATALALLAALGMFGLMLHTGSRRFSIPIGEWVVLPGADFHFLVQIAFDRLSLAFVILTLVLSGVVGEFSTRYLHREPGFTRYFLIYSLFVLGMVTAALADTIETLFTGWELVGLSSALLVGFFHQRPGPVRGGLWVWAIYRFSDAALLLAAVVLHNETKTGEFGTLLGEGPWPAGSPTIPPDITMLVGFLLLLAAAGKSGLVPFSGWLPRAMEGPTTSSAVFYGALSVHLGAFLLLRMSPFLATSWVLSLAVVVLGLATAALASLACSVQSDIKSSLSFASLAQVGIIVAEIGLGLPWVALVHIIGHACLRTLQFLRAPNLIQDRQKLENAVGGRLAGPMRGILPESTRSWLYRFALERGSLDVLLWDWLGRPFVGLLRGLDRLDRQWSQLLGGEAGKKRDRP